MTLLKFYRSAILLLCAGLFMASSLYAARHETVYVKRDQTVILAKPSGMAKIMAIVNEGEPLEVIAKARKYYRVKTSRGITGYVFNMRVTTSNPANTNSLDDDLGLMEAEPKKGETVALGESSSSHSIRGLRKAPDKKGGGATSKMADDSVREMERLQVEAGELKKFQREGGVGRYAR